jgi:hypothetical protein
MESTKKKVSLENIKTYIKVTESVLFCTPEDNSLDYSKLDVESSTYDVTYEKKTRRKELNLIYFLEEIRLFAGFPQGKCITMLSDIERRLFSSQFYRLLIFDYQLDSMLEELLVFADLVEEESDFIEREVSESVYLKISAQMQVLHPPISKGLFVYELRILANSLRMIFHSPPTEKS